MSKRAEKLVNQFREEVEEWCADPGTMSLCEEARDGLRTFTRSNDRVQARGASVDLEILANFHMTNGVRGVLNGDESGWEVIDLGYQLHFAGVRLLEAPPMELVACLLAHSISAGREGNAALLGALLTNLYAQDSSTPHPVAGLYPFVRLARALWAMQGNEAGPDPDLGPYDAVLGAVLTGTAEKALAALQAVADQHLVQAQDLGDNEPEFVSGYELLPVDVFWLLRARREAGLPNPVSIQHPLLDLATGSPPASVWPEATPTALLHEVLTHAATFSE